MSDNKLREAQITVIKKEPGKAWEIVPLFENSLSAFQKAVGGYIETVTFTADFCIICNEEGRFLGLPYNGNLCGVDFFGTVLGVGLHGDEFASVPRRFINDAMMTRGADDGISPEANAGAQCGGAGEKKTRFERLCESPEVLAEFMYRLGDELPECNMKYCPFSDEENIDCSSDNNPRDCVAAMVRYLKEVES